jgi:hypothetical protein
MTAAHRCRLLARARAQSRQSQRALVEELEACPARSRARSCGAGHAFGLR